jgi:uncharacterized membrane protein
MFAPQIHLMLNHVPVLGALFGTFALAAGMRSRNDTLTRAALVMLVVAAAVAIPVYITGGLSEDSVEKMAGVHEATIESHEDMAKVSTLGLAVLGLGALVALSRSRRRPPSHRFVAALLAVAIVLSGALAWTAHLGGQIRHSEIRSGSASPASAQTDENSEERE